MRKRAVVFFEEFKLTDFSIYVDSSDEGVEIVRRAFESLELTGHIKLDLG